MNGKLNTRKPYDMSGKAEGCRKRMDTNIEMKEIMSENNNTKGVTDIAQVCDNVNIAETVEEITEGCNIKIVIDGSFLTPEQETGRELTCSCGCEPSYGTNKVTCCLEIGDPDETAEEHVSKVLPDTAKATRDCGYRKQCSSGLERCSNSLDPGLLPKRMANGSCSFSRRGSIHNVIVSVVSVHVTACLYVAFIPFD